MADDTDTRAVCSICLQGIIQPKILGCGHCFCCTCSDEDDFACPLCFRSIRFPERGVIECSNQSLVTCDLCEDEVNAGFRCETCEQNLCKSCNRMHGLLKTCKSHTVVLLETSSKTQTDGKPLRTANPKDSCPNHPTDEAVLYCKYCQTAVCSKCFIKNHNGHSYLDLEVEAVMLNAKDELKSLKLDLETNITKFQECTGSLKARLSEMYKAAETEIMKVDIRIENICGEIKKMGCEMKKSIKIIRDQETLKFENLIQEMKFLDDELKSSVNKSDIVLENSSIVQLMDWTTEMRREKTNSEVKNTDVPALRYIIFTEGLLDLKSLEKQIGLCELNQKVITLTTSFVIKRPSQNMLFQANMAFQANMTVFQYDEGVWRLYGKDTDTGIGIKSAIQLYLCLQNSEISSCDVQYACKLTNHKKHEDSKTQTGRLVFYSGVHSNMLMSIQKDELLNPQNGYLDGTSRCHVEVVITINKENKKIPGGVTDHFGNCGFTFGHGQRNFNL